MIATVLANIDASAAVMPITCVQFVASRGGFSGTNTSAPGFGVGELEKKISDFFFVRTSPLAYRTLVRPSSALRA
jgi:hypothetical protein